MEPVTGLSARALDEIDREADDINSWGASANNGRLIAAPIIHRLTAALREADAENERLREALHKSERENEALVAQRQRLNVELLSPRLTTTQAWLAGFSCAQEQGRLVRAASEASGG